MIASLKPYFTALKASPREWVAVAQAVTILMQELFAPNLMAIWPAHISPIIVGTKFGEIH